MKFKYDVTVVIPVYNAEKHLRACIDSIINQTYDFNKIQIILINDGSKDKSIEICEEYIKNNDNIVVFDNENHGVSYSRNQGIKNAQGKYIMMLDSDDMISQNTIGSLVEFFNNYYDEIDLTTYNMVYLRENGQEVPSLKYRIYNKGTGVYSLEEYPYMEQSNVNIIFKNKKNKNRYYDESMELSEDQKFNTQTLMDKQKIGFCEEATYIYRRESTGLFNTKSNPYYCFEYVLSYNESIVKDYLKDGKLPKYIQGIILNTISWRILSDEIFPYHYEKKEFDKAIKRMKNILKYLDEEMIIKHPTMQNAHKYYLLRAKKSPIRIEFNEDDKYSVYANGVLIGSYKNVGCYVNHFKLKDNKIYLNATLNDPILNDKYTIYLNRKDINGQKEKKKLDIYSSNLSYHMTNIRTNNYYNFDAVIDINNTTEFSFSVELAGKEVPLRYAFSKWVGFNSTLKRYNLIYKKKKIVYKVNEKKFSILNNSLLKSIKKTIKENIRYFKKNPKICLLRLLGHTKKEIWLYQDRGDLHDNGYIQFNNDITKKDGIKRYYICNKNDSNKNYVKFKSLKHKILYLRASKIITSFIDFSEYCPLSKVYAYYNDMLHYDLIYLQHGILHANLIRMYAKEYTEISKIVVSSNFEINNLIEKYNYTNDDLIKSGMPRINQKSKRNLKSKKIVIAPSWRKNLIGAFINNKRIEMPEVFLKSNFYTKTNDFLKSTELSKMLEKEDLILEFKLHPIFKCYKDLFSFSSDRISISFDEIEPKEYEIFITDFSSFQFDFALLQIPVIYFMPDNDEFKAGLHSYRELDLKHEDAFGNVCYNDKELIKEIKKIIKNKYLPEKKYQKRMEEFFVIDKNPCEKIYNELKERK